ncbi:hypothetical protein PVAND_012592 [Polypedilum vanderplanki]|uniref:Odorant receptor n=1 Tax=Polypedilum vanderplanki TaxID=319348 RepID=A0A9J6CM40_POLVA|nr:hypothetical protein PVAND_012592 [Polypedilum vanderplanki]
MKVLGKIFFILVFTTVTLYALSNSNYLIELSVTHEFNLEKFTTSFSYSATISMLLVRYSCIYHNKDAIQKIIDFLPKEYKISEIQPHKIDKFLNNFGTFIKIHRYFHFQALIYPPMLVLINFINTGEKMFPFEVKFPFYAFRNEIYPFLLLWVLISHYIYVLSYVVSENITYGLTTIISVELKLLAVKYQNSFSNLEDLKVFIKNQNELYDIIEELQRIYGISFFANFLMSSILLCFTAFMTSVSPDLQLLIFNAIFCLITMIQIFIQCFFGQILYDANLNLVDSIYECGWENMKDVNLKKFLVFVIKRSQKCAAFSLLGIWKITLEQFKSVSLKFQ